eukprot:752102-Hanusia_phi.AAC.4
MASSPWTQVLLHTVITIVPDMKPTDDLLNASAKYIATIPSSVCTRIIRTRGEAHAVVKHEVHESVTAELNN